MAQLGEKMNLYVVYVQNGDNAFVEAESLEEARSLWNCLNNPYGYEGAGVAYEYGGRLAVPSEIAAHESGCEYGEQPTW